MSDWRYIAARMNGDGTATIIDPDLPLQNPALTKVLSGPAGFTATIAPAIARLAADDGSPIIEEWSTAIFSEESGEIRHAALVTQVNKTNGSELSITGVGFTGYPKDMPYLGSIYFVQTDPLDIARHIWDHIQSQPGGNLGLVLDRGTKVGVLIGTELEQVEFDTVNGPVSFEAGPYKLNEWQTDDLGGNIDKLAEEYDFDYIESHAWNAARTGFVSRLDFGVPRIGRRRPDLRFVVGENVIVVPQETVPPESYASAVLLRGAGEGATMKRAYVPRGDERRLRRVAVFSDDSVKTDELAAAKARVLLNLLTGHADIAELVVVNMPSHAAFGTWTEGDEIELFTDTDWGSDEMWLRILSTTFEPEAGIARLAVVRADKIQS